MKTSKVKLFVTLAALSALPVLLSAQQTPTADQQQAPAHSASASAPVGDTTFGSSEAVAMRPVNGELVGKLDSKSAKAGDSVTVKTVQSMKTADGTAIPKGSKLLGHVTAVQAHSDAIQNSKLAIEFDRAELKGGQSLAIHSVIRSVAPPERDNSANPPDMATMPMGTSGGSPGMGGAHGASPNGAVTPTGSGTQGMGQTGTNAQPAEANSPSVGMVVGKAGDVPIRTTAIPNEFLASNASVEASGTTPALSGTLFGAKTDIHLDGGTQVVLEILPAMAR
jgi:hypothetical protein